MKTKEELIALKEEIEAMSKKLAELDEEELKEVTGGYVVATGIDTFLSPDNIESIEVLKDAASAAIYGTREAN